MLVEIPINLDRTDIIALMGVFATWLALYPSLFKPLIKKYLGKILSIDITENSYLNSIIKDMEAKNSNNKWSDKFYIDLDSELKKKEIGYKIPEAYYFVKSINRHIKEQEFNSLNNVEKIDSSHGRTFKSLNSALLEAQGNAVVTIAPPGSGKTVSLRNLTIKKAKERLAKKTNTIPIFINLGHYTDFDENENILEFENFIENYISNSGYLGYLQNGRLIELLKSGRCICFLDGIDEMPRSSDEYEMRSKSIANFIIKWPDNKFILSCREQDYNRELPFQQILLKPFDYKHIKKYLKKYFTKESYKKKYRELSGSKEVFELCKNPFYLDLTCYYINASNKIPENKVQLFNLIIKEFHLRESKKQNQQIDIKEFILSISSLAYYIAIVRMVTTIKFHDYIREARTNSNYCWSNKCIQFAINGGLILFNEHSGELRFSHNRFQEFFSSFFILTNYRESPSVLPDNAFTNLWWNESILFIAGLEDNIEYLIKMILDQRDILELENTFVQKILKLEMTILSFECIFANFNFQNEKLYNKIRDELISEYENGNALTKTKILTSFRNDKSEKTLKVIQKALKDKSIWVSEKAFFILSDGFFKMPMTLKGALNEFFRFFVEGRLISVLPSMLKCARNSKELRSYMPLFFILLFINIMAIASVIYVIYSFFNYAIFKLELAFTSDCISCLFMLTLCTGLILYSFFNNNYPILKRFLFISPLAIMLNYLAFNIQNKFFYKLIAILVGSLFVAIYSKIYKRPNEKDFSVQSINAFVFGYFTSFVYLNLTNYSNLNYEFDLPPTIANFISSSSPLINLILLFTAVTFLFIFVTRQLLTFRLLKKYTSQIGVTLTVYKDAERRCDKFEKMLNKLFILWSQKIFILRIIETMTTKYYETEEDKMLFLEILSKRVSDNHLKDAILQILENEEKKFRRTI